VARDPEQARGSKQKLPLAQRIGNPDLSAWGSRDDARAARWTYCL